MTLAPVELSVIPVAADDGNNGGESTSVKLTVSVSPAVLTDADAITGAVVSGALTVTEAA